MNEKEQAKFEQFKNVVNQLILREEQKIKLLLSVKDLVADNYLTNHIAKRNDFLSQSKDFIEKTSDLDKYNKNKEFATKYQNEFYLNIDGYRKEALQIIAAKSKQWYEKLFKSNFDAIKILHRNMLIGDYANDVTTMERAIQEIELLRHKSGY